MTPSAPIVDVSWLLLLLLVQRLLELRLCSFNGKKLRQRGAQEHGASSYKIMAGFHVLFFLSLALEAYPWHIPLDARHLALALPLLGTQVLRYWTIFSLGPYWNTRILVVPGTRTVRKGPYRFLRHPNYLVITLEVLLFPALLDSPVTLVCFGLLNLAVLRQRISLEERALRESTDYADVFGSSRK